MVARRVLLKSRQLEPAVDALIAGGGGPGSPVAPMRVKEAAPMQALLSQSVLAAKLCLIPAMTELILSLVEAVLPAIPATAAVVILEAAGTVTAENPVSDSLPSFPSSRSSRG